MGDDEQTAEVEYVRDQKNFVDASTDDGRDELLELMLTTAYPAKRAQDC